MGITQCSICRGDDQEGELMIIVAHKLAIWVNSKSITTHTAGQEASKTISHQLQIQEGYCATPTPYGTVITGGSPDKQAAYLWDGLEFTQLPAMTHEHYNHCAVVAYNFLFVISGQTQAVEKIAPQEKTQVEINCQQAWEDAGEVNVPREYATATTMGDRIYLIGGINDSAQTLTSIEYFESSWVLCDIYFQSVNRIHGAGAVPINDKEFLLFGGKTGPAHNTRLNRDAYKVNIQECTIEFFKSISIVGDFNWAQPAWSDSMAAIYSKTGYLIHFNQTKLQFKVDNLERRPELETSR